jgi:hypothetical protein
MMDPVFTAGALNIEAMADPAMITLTWKGQSGDRQPGKLVGRYLSDALEAASTRKVPLEMHFETLQYFNSATITALIQTIREARAKQVRLRIVYGAAQWQRLSFEALRVFARDEWLELRQTDAS